MLSRSPLSAPLNFAECTGFRVAFSVLDCDFKIFMGVRRCVKGNDDSRFGSMASTDFKCGQRRCGAANEAPFAPNRITHRRNPTAAKRSSDLQNAVGRTSP